MKFLAILALAVVGMATGQPAAAQSAPPSKISGVISAVNGDEVDLTGPAGDKIAVTLDDKARIALSIPITVNDIILDYCNRFRCDNIVVDIIITITIALGISVTLVTVGLRFVDGRRLLLLILEFPHGSMGCTQTYH